MRISKGQAPPVCEGVVRLRDHRPYGPVAQEVQNRCRGGPDALGDLAVESGPPRYPITMDQAPTPVSQWRFRARTVLRRVIAAERRFSASISVNKITMLAAADELDAATKDATVWLTANPCPEEELGVHVAEMLNTCNEVALVAQRAVAGPFAGSEGVMARLRDLLTVINFHSAVLDAW